MKIIKLIIGSILVLALGTTAIGFAKEKKLDNEKTQAAYENFNRPTDNSMFSMIEQYGYGVISQDIKDGDYEAMEEFMNNLSSEDYQKMIDIMRENGYENMASVMERIGKEEMISMYNAMDDGAGCFR